MPSYFSKIASQRNVQQIHVKKTLEVLDKISIVKVLLKINVFMLKEPFIKWLFTEVSRHYFWQFDHQAKQFVDEHA